MVLGWLVYVSLIKARIILEGGTSVKKILPARHYREKVCLEKQRKKGRKDGEKEGRKDGKKEGRKENTPTGMACKLWEHFLAW